MAVPYLYAVKKMVIYETGFSELKIYVQERYVMYISAKVICMLLVSALGIFMAIFPEKATREDLRDDPDQVKKMRRNGLLLTVLGIVFAFLLFAVNNFL